VTVRIEPYKMWSGGAKALGERAGILRATKKQVAKHGDFDFIINWGNSQRRFNGEYINKPEAVANASDKLATASILGSYAVPQPDYTRDIQVAQQWYDEGRTVVCRTLLRANSGRGIQLASKDGQDLVKAPLYTKYVKKSDEYRVHVVGGKAIDVQQKKKRQEVDNEKVNYQIRNACNGWVFCRDGVVAPTCVTDAAVRAVDALGLDFGAVDIGYNRKHDRADVYEVNTAPGLEGTTLDKYYEAFSVTLPELSRGAYARRRAAKGLL
jgi:glutathione synthase/RimK-type ligase-like ATP-grasp enzyme